MVNTAQYTRWTFTLNNYTPEEVELLNTWGSLPSTKYLVYGKEIAPTTGTPHLQGFFILSTKASFSLIRREFPCRRASALRSAVKSSPICSEYCKKDGDFTEFGECPFPGKRTDLSVTREWIDEFTRNNGRAPTEREVALTRGDAFIRCHRALMHYARVTAPPPQLRVGELRGWQSELEQQLEEAPVDERKITFYVDPEGNKGKTWFTGYMFTKFPDNVQIIGSGRKEDMAYALDATKCIVFLAVPRGGMEFFQYSFVESLKDRMVFSTKYEPVMKIMIRNPHVIVMCNEYPDETKLSADRFDIRPL